MDKRKNKRDSEGTKTKAFRKGEEPEASPTLTESQSGFVKPSSGLQKVDIGLDASTATVGVCVIDSETGDLVKLTYLDLSSKAKYDDIYDKVDATRIFLKDLINSNPWEINKVSIEEFAKQFTPGFSSADTLFTLAMFNHAICQFVFDTYNMKPHKVSVRTARKELYVNVDYKDKSKTTKQKVFDKVKEMNPTFPWFTYMCKAGKSKGLEVFGKQNQDMADAWVVAKGGWMTQDRLKEEEVKRGRILIKDPITGKKRPLTLEEHKQDVLNRLSKQQQH